MTAATTPDGEASRCTVCGSAVKGEASSSGGPSACTRCGHLIWFTWENLGDVEVIKPTERVLTGEALDSFLDSVAIKPGVHLVLDLTDVHFFVSVVLARLVGLKKRVSSVGGKFTIRHVRPELMDLFKITHLEHIFDMEA